MNLRKNFKVILNLKKSSFLKFFNFKNLHSKFKYFECKFFIFYFIFTEKLRVSSKYPSSTSFGCMEFDPEGVPVKITSPTFKVKNLET